jgi:hypothetical protein
LDNGGEKVSTVALIVFVVVAVLLLAMLIAGGRKAAQARARQALGPIHDDVQPYRSHAEASRRGDAKRL